MRMGNISLLNDHSLYDLLGGNNFLLEVELRMQHIFVDLETIFFRVYVSCIF